ncbi:MAG: tetratricopeptide repeat protein, partial [Candidatus Anstonellales archaeon]
MTVAEKEKNQQIADALCKQADGFFEKGNFEQAKNFYSEALKYDPNNEKAKKVLAEIERKELYDKGMAEYIKNTKDGYEKAIDSFAQILKKYPNSEEAKKIIDNAYIAKAYRHLAIIYEGLGLIEEQIKCLRSAYEWYCKSERFSHMANNCLKEQNAALAKLESSGGILSTQLLPFLIAAPPSLSVSKQNRGEEKGQNKKGQNKKKEEHPLIINGPNATYEFYVSSNVNHRSLLGSQIQEGGVLREMDWGKAIFKVEGLNYVAAVKIGETSYKEAGVDLAKFTEYKVYFVDQNGDIYAANIVISNNPL